jgi:two-component system, NarL family, nitrate/nitrite response regulator NarL
MNKPFTIYLADDHQIVIDGLKLLISNEESMQVIGHAIDGETAKQVIIIKRPDIALVDLRMPGLDGLELIITLKRVLPSTKFIILSMHDSQRYMRDAMVHEASGYLLKNAGKAELMKCLSIVLKGEKYFPNIQKKKEPFKKSLFTPREAEILKLILDEYTTAEIANKLSLSHHTVDVHRKSIVRKANTKTPLGLSKFLHENQIEL